MKKKKKISENTKKMSEFSRGNLRVSSSPLPLFFFIRLLLYSRAIKCSIKKRAFFYSSEIKLKNSVIEWFISWNLVTKKKENVPSKFICHSENEIKNFFASFIKKKLFQKFTFFFVFFFQNEWKKYREVIIASQFIIIPIRNATSRCATFILYYTPTVIHQPVKCIILFLERGEEAVEKVK